MKQLFLLLLLAAVLPLQAQNLQTEIDSAFIHYFKTGRMEEIDRIINALHLENKSSNNRYLNYWTAYGRYKKSLCAQSNPAEEFQKTARIELSEALKCLNKIKNKESEDYALLAILKNYSVAFVANVKIPFVSGEAKKYAQKAIDMDPQNLRAYLALGIRDYYTPAVYGGKTQFEELFLKAISLRDKYGNNPNDPSWGKNDAYYYLLDHYCRKDMEKARHLFSEAIELYPDDPRILKFK
jgi:tetratricopeptide (TPR) repeat protein